MAQLGRMKTEESRNSGITYLLLSILQDLFLIFLCGLSNCFKLGKSCAIFLDKKTTRCRRNDDVNYFLLNFK